MSKITAELEPLDGSKYYGSIINLTNCDDPRANASIVVWVNEIGNTKEHWEPSSRELADWDEEEYGEFEICDNHYESTAALKIARMIVASIDGMEI